MDYSPEMLADRSQELFGQRSGLLSLWQDVAENFYPERADFNTVRSQGADFSAHLMTSAPPLHRRKLADIVGYMLRADKWFNVTVAREDKLDTASKKWLEWASGVQYRAMYDPVANFARTTKEGDGDYVTFGQNVISVDVGSKADAMLYKNFHLRDCAWSENENGKVDETHVRYKATAIELRRLFGDQISDETQTILSLGGKNIYQKIECVHLIMPWDSYHPNEANPLPRMPFVSVHIELKTKKVLEFKQIRRNRYNVARWATLSGSPYAHSPAIMAAIPDARMLQAMNLVILNAGEKAVDPPMIGYGEALRSDLNLFPGGFTSVEMEHAGKLSEVLRPLSVDKSGLPMGFQMMEAVKAGMGDVFFLNELRLPSLDGREKTAYEFSERVREAAQAAMPILEPIESDYNGGLCDKTFGTLMDGGFFGSMDNIPEALLSQDVSFKFKSPYRDALSQSEAAKLGEALEIIGAASELDPDVSLNMDIQMAVRDSLEATGVPIKWIKDEKTVFRDLEARREQRQQEQKMAQLNEVAQLAQGAAA